MAGKSRRFGISILIFAVLVSIYLFMHSSFFNIDKIYVTGLSSISRDEITALAGIKTGTNIFLINQNTVEKSIKVNPMVKNAIIIRRYPRSVEIHITERKMWAVVAYNQKYIIVDDEGVCLNRVKDINILNYPLITFSSMPAHIILGQPVNAGAVRMIKKVWDALGSSVTRISDFHYLNQEKGIIIYTNAGTEVRFGNLDRLQEKVKYFNQIFQMEDNQQNGEQQVLEYVDLRYKGEPVVKTRS